MDLMEQAAEAGDRSSMIYLAKAFETGTNLGTNRSVANVHRVRLVLAVCWALLLLSVCPSGGPVSTACSVLCPTANQIFCRQLLFSSVDIMSTSEMMEGHLIDLILCSGSFYVPSYNAFHKLLHWVSLGEMMWKPKFGCPG